MIFGVQENELILAGIGGLLICIASSLHLLIAGRLTGFASIVFGVVRLEKANYQWKLSIICGLVLTSTVTYLKYGFKEINFKEIKTTLFDPPEKLIGNLNFIGFGLSGLLAGFGTKLGNGCTSGHGVCGLPRFSIRSFVAVACFMCLGLMIATVKHDNPFLNETQSLDMVKSIDFVLSAYIFLGLSIVIILALLLFNINQRSNLLNNLTSFIVGIIFSLALILSGMVKRTKVIGFLTISDKWDPSLAVVMAVAVLGNILTFYYIIQIKKLPILNQILEIPINRTIDWKLILGECLFGLGWGLGGMCPGPAMLLLFFLTPHITACWMISFIIGQQLVPPFLSLIDRIRLRNNINYQSLE